MLKLMMCVKRRPDLTRREFADYWQDHHGALVRMHQDVLHIRRYVQTLTLDDALTQESLRVSRSALKAEFDGCAELWWDSLADHLATRKTPQGVEALQALMVDERRFVDVSRSQLWYGTERLIIPD